MIINQSKLLRLDITRVPLKHYWIFTYIFHPLFCLSEIILPPLNTIIGSLILQTFQYSLVFNSDFHEFPPPYVTVHAFLSHNWGYCLWCGIVDCPVLIARHYVGHLF